MTGLCFVKGGLNLCDLSCVYISFDTQRFDSQPSRASGCARPQYQSFSPSTTMQNPKAFRCCSVRSPTSRTFGFICAHWESVEMHCPTHVSGQMYLQTTFPSNYCSTCTTTAKLLLPVLFFWCLSRHSLVPSHFCAVLTHQPQLLHLK